MKIKCNKRRTIKASLDDASAIDSQINSRNVNDLIAEYNDKSEEF